MHLLSWHVLSLPRVEFYLPRHIGSALPFRHLGTKVQPEPLDDGRRLGDTVWGTMVDGRLVAASWDWIEILPNVVCMVDPSTVLTNIRFMDENDCYEDPSQAMLRINGVIHSTPWQGTVHSALVLRETPTPPAAASGLASIQPHPRPTGRCTSELDVLPQLNVHAIQLHGN